MGCGECTRENTYSKNCISLRKEVILSITKTKQIKSKILILGRIVSKHLEITGF